MQVLKCYYKPEPNAQMQGVKALYLEPGFGIIGDANANACSPRHVLLVDDWVYKAFRLPPASLRENLLVKGIDLTKLTSGQILSVGKNVFLRVTIPCESCVKLNDIRIGLAKQVAHFRGVLARVLHGGAITVGDNLRIFGQKLSRIPKRPSERVYQLLNKVPNSRVISYSQITLSIGVTKNFVRVIPKTLRAAPIDLPVHRVVNSNGGLIPIHIPNQQQLLIKEGVVIKEQEFVEPNYIWCDDPFSDEEHAFLLNKSQNFLSILQ